jgi:hypothetical protein
MDLELIKNVSATSECKIFDWILEFRSDLEAMLPCQIDFLRQKKGCNLDFEPFDKDLGYFHFC